MSLNRQLRIIVPYADPKKRLQAAATSMRKRRAYLSAVAAGNPKAIAAERARDPMRPFKELEARLRAMPKAEREPYRAELARVLAECDAANTLARKAEYHRLRAEVIAEATFADVLAAA